MSGAFFIGGMTMGKLGNLIYNQAKQREESEVSAIVDGSPDQRGGFSDVCNKSKVERSEVALSAARSELRDNPGLVDHGGGVRDFRSKYFQDIPADQLDQLINETYSRRHAR
jgi:hypothetical protein